MAEPNIGGIKVPLSPGEEATNTLLGITAPSVEAVPQGDLPTLPIQGTSIGDTARRASETTPKAKAYDLELGNVLGLNPNNITDSNRKRFDQQRIRQNIELQSDAAPVTQGYMKADQDLTALLSGNVKNVADGERAVQGLTFDGALSNGVSLLKSLGWRFLEVGGELVDEDFEAFAQREAELEEARASVRGHKQEFSGIFEGTLGEQAEKFFIWAKQTAGEGIPLMAPSLAGGAAGFGVGLAVGGPAAPLTATIGAMLGAFIPSFILGVGEVQQSIKSRDKNVEAPLVALGGGVIIGALDSLLAGKLGTIARKAVGREAAEEMYQKIAFKVAAMKVASETAGGLTIEGITEGAQFIVSETFAAHATDTEIDAEQFTKELIENIAAGMLLGAGATSTTSTGGQIVRARREKRAMDESNRLEKEGELKGLSAVKAAELKTAQLRAQGVDSVFLPMDVLLRYARSQADPVEALANLGVSEALAGVHNMATITVDVKGIHGASDRAVEVVKSPTFQTAKRLLTQSQFKRLRGTKNLQTGELFIWDAALATHEEMNHLLGGQAFREGAAGNGPVFRASDFANPTQEFRDFFQANATGKVELSLEAFAEHLHGTEAYDLIAPHLTITKDTVSLAEAVEEAFIEEEDIENYEADLEAYDAAEDLKERVQETIQKVKAKPKSGHQIIDDAGRDVEVILDTLIQNVQERKGGTDEIVRTGRLTKLDSQISEQDRIIANEQTNLERATKAKTATSAIQKRLNAAIAKRDDFIEQQTALELPEVVVGVGEGVEAEFRAQQAEDLRPTAIEIKTKTLQDFEVKITAEIIREVRKAFRAGLDVGKDLIKRKKSLKKEIRAALKKTGVKLTKTSQIGVQLDRLNNAPTDKALTKLLPVVQSRIAVIVGTERRKQLEAAIKKVVAGTASKIQGGRKVGFFGPGDDAAKAQEVMDMARTTINLGVGVAEERLEKILSSKELPSTEGLLERQLLGIAAHRPEADNATAEQALLDLQEIKLFGKGAALNKIMARRDRANLDATEGREFTTQGKPVKAMNTVGLFARMGRGLRDFRDGLASMHNAWDEVLDDTFNKLDVDARRLIKSLRFTKYLQRAKGRMLKWEKELNEIGYTAFGIEEGNYRKLMDRHHKDAQRIDFGEFEDKNGDIVRLQYSPANIRKLWMERQDPTIRDVVTDVEGNAFTDEMMKAMFNVLNDDPTHYDYALAQLAFYRKLYPQVNAVHRRVYGVNLPFNEFYSPIQRDKGDTVQDGSKDSFGADRVIADEQTYRRSLPPALKKRLPGVIAPLKRRSDIGAMHRYMHDMAHFIETTEQVMHMKSVFASRPLRKAIEAMHSKARNKEIDEFLEDFGTGYAARGIVAEQSIAMFNRRFSTAALAIKPSIGTKQLVSWLAMAENIPVTDFIKSQADFFKNPKKNMKTLFELSAALQARGSSIDFELAKIGSENEEILRWRHNQTMEDLFFKFIKLGDRMPIYAGGWAVYQNALKQGKSQKQAIDAFEDAMNSTQQSVDIDKMSALQRSSAIGRTLTMFMTARMALLRGEMRAIRQVRRKKISYREFGKRMAIYHFLMPMMIQFIASGFRWDTDRQLVAAFMGQLNSFVIFGDILAWAATKAFTDEPDPWREANQIPMAQVFQDMMEGASDALAPGASVEDMMEGLFEMADAIGLATGKPIEQTRNAIEGGYNLLAEGEIEKGVLQLWGLSEAVSEKARRADFVE